MNKSDAIAELLLRSYFLIEKVETLEPLGKNMDKERGELGALRCIFRELGMVEDEIPTKPCLTGAMIEQLEITKEKKKKRDYARYIRDHPDRFGIGV